MKEMVAVTIPIYKETLTDFEILSLKQCIRVLNKYPIFFIAPQSLNIGNYEAYFKTSACNIERFDDAFFLNIAGYNKLLLDIFFYRRFSQFRYILIYQLDAYVFADKLSEWCDKNYDYVAAPSITFEEGSPGTKEAGGMRFLSRYKYVYEVLNKCHISNYKFRHIENGGFSLRKVSAFIALLSLLKKKAKKWPLNEDTFFMYWFNILFFWFSIPDELSALPFSFERNPRNCYKLNNSKLPFGCHAYLKYDFDFWKPFIVE